MKFFATRRDILKSGSIEFSSHLSAHTDRSAAVEPAETSSSSNLDHILASKQSIYTPQLRPTDVVVDWAIQSMSAFQNR